jgi:hypothetical protein
VFKELFWDLHEGTNEDCVQDSWSPGQDLK